MYLIVSASGLVPIHSTQQTERKNRHRFHPCVVFAVASLASVGRQLRQKVRKCVAGVALGGN